MRISGINIPDNKHLSYGLTAVYGIGLVRAKSVLAELGIDNFSKPTDLSPEQENAVREKIESFMIEGELRRKTSSDIKRLKDINAYRGLRHKANLPSRGQRTKTNARTRRGKKSTVGGTAKKVASKT